tara:strand:- start:15 stop:836 length:822 start_codon:yes stop_codon:yes gene_type:complete
MTSEEYGQYIDDFELGADVMPGESLTDYIERRRREFDSKADGGAIGIEVLFTDKKPRKNFFMGGPALTGQALSIYNSMSAYGFSDQEIANALAERGLPTTTTTTTPVINTAPNIIGRDGDDGPSNTVPKDPFAGLGFSSANFGLGADKDVMDYEADAAKVGRTFKGQLAKAYMGLKSLPTPFNIASRAIGNISDFFKQKAKEKAAAEAAAAQTAFDKIMSSAQSQKDFYDSLNKGRGATSTAESRATAGDAPGYAGPSPFAKGGLATMFTRRR